MPHFTVHPPASVDNEELWSLARRLSSASCRKVTRTVHFCKGRRAPIGWGTERRRCTWRCNDHRRTSGSRCRSGRNCRSCSWSSGQRRSRRNRTARPGTCRSCRRNHRRRRFWTRNSEYRPPNRRRWRRSARCSSPGRARYRPSRLGCTWPPPFQAGRSRRPHHRQDPSAHPAASGRWPVDG